MYGNRYRLREWLNVLNKERASQLLRRRLEQSRFVWQIPSLSYEHKLILSTGYTRRNFDKYMTFPIICLFAEYYSNDTYSLQDIKEAKCKTSFVSPTFSLCGFKWYLEICPNGSNDDNHGSIILFLCLVFPLNLGKIEISFTLSLIEKNNISCTRHIRMSEERYYSGWRRNVLLLKDIQNLKQLTFVAELSIIDIFDKNEKSVFNAYCNKYNIFNNKPIPLPAVNYHWRITDNLSSGSLRYCLSESYQNNEFKWYLKLRHNKDGKIRLFLKFIPFPKHITGIDVHFHLNVHELDTIIESNTIFDINNLSLGWNIIDEKDLEKVTELTTSGYFIIRHVFDENKDEIPNYVENNALKLNNINIKLPVANYKWSIAETNKIATIKNATFGQEFQGKIFFIGDLKWFLSIFPNGNNKENEGKFTVTLNLIAFPPILSKVICNVKIIFHELNINAYGELVMDQSWYLRRYIAKLDDIRDLETITIGLELILLDVYDKNEKVITNYIDRYEFREIRNLPITEYEWKITDKDEMDKIKSAPNIFGFANKPFIAHGLKFYITIHPNGSRLSRKNSMNIFLHLRAIQSTVMIQYDLEWVESNNSHNEILRIAPNARYCGGSTDWRLNTNDLQKLNRMTIRVKIALIDVYENDKIVTEQYMNQNILKEIQLTSTMIKPSYWRWRIKEDIFKELERYRKGVSYKSAIFAMYGMNWYLDFYPKGKSLELDEGCTICINIVSLPSINTVIDVRYTLNIKELGINVIIADIFNKDQLCISWGPDRMRFEQLKVLKDFTIELKLELLDVFDGDINITDRYMTNDYDKKMMTNIEELDSLIQKMNVLNELEQNNLKHDVIQYKKHVDNQLNVWFVDQVKLPKYYDVFIENNIDNLQMMKMMSANDLDQMNITNVSHKLQIMIEIAKIS